MEKCEGSGSGSQETAESARQVAAATNGRRDQETKSRSPPRRTKTARGETEGKRRDKETPTVKGVKVGTWEGEERLTDEERAETKRLKDQGGAICLRVRRGERLRRDVGKRLFRG